MAMGKSGEGEEDSHSLKPWWGDLPWNPSTMASSVGSQDVMRWQFARNTQLPSRRPSSIRRVAMGACPWPSATLKNLRAAKERSGTLV